MWMQGGLIGETIFADRYNVVSQEIDTSHNSLQMSLNVYIKFLFVYGLNKQDTSCE